MMKTSLFLHIILTISGLWLLNGCSDDSGRDCFKSTGEVRTESRYFSPFHLIDLNDNIHLVLTQDTLVNSVEVEAGENLLDGIVTEVTNGQLVIRNENSCNWTRSFDVPITVYIRFATLDTIIFRAAGDLTFLTPWKADSIQVDVWEGAGLIYLKLDVFKSRVYVHYGVPNVVITGSSQVSFISSKGYGPVNALGLQTNYTFMSTQSPNDCYVRATTELGVTIENIGNVYYGGSPGHIDLVRNGSGSLIPVD